MVDQVRTMNGVQPSPNAFAAERLTSLLEHKPWSNRDGVTTTTQSQCLCILYQASGLNGARSRFFQHT